MCSFPEKICGFLSSKFQWIQALILPTIIFLPLILSSLKISMNIYLPIILTCFCVGVFNIFSEYSACVTKKTKLIRNFLSMIFIFFVNNGIFFYIPLESMINALMRKKKAENNITNINTKKQNYFKILLELRKPIVTAIIYDALVSLFFVIQYFFINVKFEDIP
jgi:hypothetical protein